MKYFGRAFWIILALILVIEVAFPRVNGFGAAWLTVHVTAIDATTNQPIPGATVMLIPEFRAGKPDMRVLPPTILTAQTGNGGTATVKDQFGATFDSFTSISVGTSTVRCEAAGHLPAEVRLAESGCLRFRNFIIYKQPKSIALTLSLKRQ